MGQRQACCIERANIYKVTCGYSGRRETQIICVEDTHHVAAALRNDASGNMNGRIVEMHSTGSKPTCASGVSVSRS